MRTSAPLNLVRQARQAKIGQQHVAARVQHDVAGLEIAMQDSLFVRRRQPRAQFAGDLDTLVGGKAADPANQRRQILPVHVFHRKEHLAFDLAEIVNAADVGMRNLARDANFVAEARQSGFIAGDALGQKLERDWLLERQVVGAVDLAHSAFAEQRDDAIALREQRSGRKPAFGASR